MSRLIGNSVLEVLTCHAPRHALCVSLFTIFNLPPAPHSVYQHATAPTSHTITSKAKCLFTNLKNAPGRTQIIVACYPTMGQPDLGSETHISDIRPTHIGIPSKRENRRSAATPLASTSRHTAGRAVRSPVPEHAEEWAKFWSREHTVSRHGQAYRERFFAICAK